MVFIMRTSALLGLVGVLGFSTLVGCAGAATDETEAQGGAATSVGVFANGTYDDTLSIVIKGTQVSGSYYSQIGDPARGGATCGFTFAGFVDGERAQITATDGFDVTGGELVSEGSGVHIRLNSSPSACGRTSPNLATEGDTYGNRKALAADITGFRSVKRDVEKAFFHDRAGGAPRAAYVTMGDTVEITGAEQNGFIPARFDKTKGFVKASDLSGTFAPVPKDTLRGSYVLQGDVSVEASFEVVTSHDRDMFFNYSGATRSGSATALIQQGHAKLVGDTATYTDGSCTLKFAFASDAKSVEVAQDGQCGDFGFNFVAAGSYDRQ